MTKRYVNQSDNLAESWQSNIYLDSLVIVVDGSYMTDEDGKHVSGIDFMTPDRKKSELLKVLRVNIPFKTDYSLNASDRPVLGCHNNCEIEGFDGKKYHCSRINIKPFYL